MSSTILKTFQEGAWPTKIGPTVVMPIAHQSFVKPDRPKCSRHALPSALYRAGTSKGLFIQRKHLPEAKSAWAPILLSAMGSEDGDGKQLNGVGGGTSTTSKVAIVEKSSREGIDVDYTFVQVAPDSPKLDMTGNCGNMVSGVGPYALDEGIIVPRTDQDQTIVRIFNTNTGKVIEETIQVDTQGHAYEEGTFTIPGTRSHASPIKVAFIDPAGSMTGKMFPTGARAELLTVNSGRDTEYTIRATLIDVANPFIFVDSSSLPESYHNLGPESPESLRLIESIRREGAVRMGLADNLDAAALTRGTPKIAVLSAPEPSSLSPVTGDSPDILVTSFSMGRVHPSLQLTGAVCLSAAIGILGTTASKSCEIGVVCEQTEYIGKTLGFETPEPSPQPKRIRIQHRSGVIETEVCLGTNKQGDCDLQAVSVMRSARRLFEGKVFYTL